MRRMRRTQTAEPLPAPTTLAAIDMGSNSFRLELAQVAHGRYRRIDYLKETVRLGGGLNAEGLLTEAAMQRGLECLARFAHRLQDLPSAHVRAVATQTLREARNRDEFLRRAHEVLGHEIEVISGREEARLIYGGVARLQPSDRSRLVIDIGGRSTEMIIGTGRTPRTAESFQVGSVSLSLRFFPEGRYTVAAFRAAQIAAGAEFEEAMSTFTPSMWAEAAGSSGTVGAIAQILQAHRITDGTITPDALRWCIEQCLIAGHQDRLALEGLKPERRAIVAGGLCILYTLATHFHIPALAPARGALRQGVIFELAERLDDGLGSATPRDLRQTSVRLLQQRFGVDLAQSRRVRRLALALFQSLPQGLTRRAAEAVRDLAWAADLHEIGMMVSHHDHHRHSAYLVGNVDAAGFSQSQQRELAMLVLAQRGGLRKVQAALAQELFAWQALCLRLAIILCHARIDVDPRFTRLRVSGTRATLRLDPDWAASHPRALFLLGEEVEAWARAASPVSLDLK